MSSYDEQIRAFDAARLSVNALGASARQQIETIFDEWDSGLHSKSSVRHRLENVIRQSYRASAAVARTTAVLNSDLKGWQPAETFNTEYLQSLLSDVRRNLRDYKSGKLSRESAILRMQLSADVAASRGFTDQTIDAYVELQDFGYVIKKYWLANFENNVPCDHCRALHGTSVGLEENFLSSNGLRIYRDLKGPPRHPNCKCRLVILISSLETAFSIPNFDIPSNTPTPTTVHSSDIRNMSKGIFSGVVAALKAILKFLRR